MNNELAKTTEPVHESQNWNFLQSFLRHLTQQTKSRPSAAFPGLRCPRDSWVFHLQNLSGHICSGDTRAILKKITDNNG